MSWDSEFFSLPPVHWGLRPVQAGGLPIWIGGASKAAMHRVGCPVAMDLAHAHASDLWCDRMTETVASSPSRE